MKLRQDSSSDAYALTHVGDGFLLINKTQRIETGVVIMADRLVEDWGKDGFEALTVADFEVLRDLGKEIVLIGTGPKQRFPHPSLLRPLMDGRIGFEIMDFAAACRTYNVLASENRSVAVALLFH